MTFSPTPPTKPGAYWFKWNIDDMFPLLILVSVTLSARFGEKNLGNVSAITGVWSPSLVPVDEVEKALYEGARIGYSRACNRMEDNISEADYKLSRAKRVVEGTEDESV